MGSFVMTMLVRIFSLYRKFWYSWIFFSVMSLILAWFYYLLVLIWILWFLCLKFSLGINSITKWIQSFQCVPYTRGVYHFLVDSRARLVYRYLTQSSIITISNCSLATTPRQLHQCFVSYVGHKCRPTKNLKPTP